MHVQHYPKLQTEEPNPPSRNPLENPPENPPGESAQIFRLSNITQIQRELEQDLTKYSRTKRRYSSIFNGLTYTNSAATTATAITTGTGACLLATGVGIPAAGVLGFVSLGLGACSLSLGVATKKVMPKLQKHTAIEQLVTAKLSSFRLIISKALQDSTLTDEEFNRLQADYGDYKRQKFDLQKKMKASFSQQQDVDVLKKECLKQVNEKLNSILKT